MPAGLDGNPDPIMTPQRSAVLDHVAGEIARRRADRAPLLVGIDGIDGAGKTTFADELVSPLQARGLTVIRATVDSFHRRRAARWQRGRTSPVGFYRDSHDLDALRRHLLDPFLAGSGASYRTAVFDEPSDRPVDAPTRTVSGDEILLFDGIFLCRPELRDCWDMVVFLDGQARVNLTRLGHVLADAPTDPTGPSAPTDLVGHTLEWVERLDRYASGMRLYLDSDQPIDRADLVIDNNDLTNPTVRIDRSSAASDNTGSGVGGAEAGDRDRPQPPAGAPGPRDTSAVASEEPG